MSGAGTGADDPGRLWADAPGEPADLRYAAYARERLAAMPPPADPEAFALAYHLLQLAYLLVTDLETRIHRPRGWTLPGFRLMFKLWLLGPTQPVRLAGIAAMSRSAVTNAVNTLERAGLVERRPVPGDGRAVVVALTAAGEKAVREAFAEQTLREREWFAALAPAEREHMTELLARILRSRPPGVP
ncbi:DNA-binding MarR family transcriptional regulator [Thermocatellispora tengchongensis]|uniref:DNA-binding MarR family transcriptional regulator n=1 Tax=Thermocatellispora tengchongensis TaxID=1073253 RepID=A0A840P569_9ACTN|nr:MarR family transcriptional regulator [Thermocatellispora tengchongensis]MBB5133676.1 DNA-binding MarR family transcriptional regulator [Thermocatellispora tengchongensis]